MAVTAQIPVKCMWVFASEAGYGWTEIHYKLYAGPNPNLVGVLADMDTNVTAARRAILGLDCSIVGTRASYPVQGGVASLNAVQNTVGSAGGVSGSQNDSLAVGMIDGSFSRKKKIHVRGMPATWTAGEIWNPAVPVGITTSGVYMSAYQSALLNKGYGWLGKQFPAVSFFGPVTGYTVGAGFLITFNVQASAGSAPLQNLISNANAPSTYECKFSKLNYSHSELNRSFVVAPVVPVAPATVTQLVTVGPVAAGPFLAAGKFNISVTGFIAYAVAGPIVLGERRMGKRLGLYPGRGRRRPVI